MLARGSPNHLVLSWLHNISSQRFCPRIVVRGIRAHVVRGIEADQIKGEIASGCFVTGSGCLQLHTKTADIKLSSVLG